MARSTRQPIPQQKSLYAEEEDSEVDTEIEETPKGPRQNHSKRRFSELQLDKDASVVSDPGRVPLKSVNMNDDEAEKRKRRRSAKAARLFHSDNAEAGPSSEGIVATDSLAPSAIAKQKQAQLASVAPTPIVNVPFDVMSSNFEEWMKMATDNVRIIESSLLG
jgi:condensin complex subunit 2